MKKSFSIILLMLFPILVMAQASGGQIIRPARKQQNTQQTGNKTINSSPKQKVVREITYESTLSAEERRIWEEEKAKAKEKMKKLAYNIKVLGLERGSNFYNGVACWENKNKTFCFINKNGEILFELSPSITDVKSFHDEYAVIVQKFKDNSRRYGIIDKSGRTVVNAEYDWISDYSKGLFQVKKGGKYGFIDKNGDVIIPFVYESAGNFHEGVATVKKDGKWGYVNKSNNTIIPFEYDGTRDFSEGLAPVEKKEKWGYINKSNTLIIPYSYWYAFPFQSGLSQVILENTARDEVRTGIRVRSGYINNQGKYVIPLQRGNLGFFSDDLIEINGSYFDNHGKLIIQTKYDHCGDFSEGLAFVGKKKSKPGGSPNPYTCGFINKKGQIVIDFKYDGADGYSPEFSEGLVNIWYEGRNGYIDKYGNSTFDFE